MASLQKIKSRGINYYSVVECRRINGKPTPVTIAYLGNIENIIKTFNNKNTLSDDVGIKSYEYGAVYALWEIAKKHKIIGFFNAVFPEQTRNGLTRGQTLLINSIYRAIYPGSKNEFSQWVTETSLPSIAKFNTEKMTSQHFWDQMDGINEDMLHRAEDKIAEHVLKYYDIQPSKLALDYTNYFTYIDSNNKNCEIAKRGLNKQKRNDLRQFSLGLVTTKELTIPLCSYVYKGNVNDVTAFPDYLKLLEERIINYSNAEEITLVFDNGSVSKKNLEEIKKSIYNIHYVCAFSMTSCKELFDIPLSKYEKTIIYEDKEILCHRITKKIWGEDRVCILIYSEDLYRGQYEGLIKSIKKKENLLHELREQIKNKKSRISKKVEDINTRINGIIKGDFGNDIFGINIIGDEIVQDIDFFIKDDVVAKLSNKHFGKKLIATDHKTWETKEILEAYWEQNCIESIFKDSKNTQHFSIKPQFHWTDSKVRVHTFCCLIGLLLTSLLRKELLDSGIKMQNKKIINELSQIREVYLLAPDKKTKTGFSVEKRMEQMSKIQSEMWTALEKSVFNFKHKK